MASDKLKGKQFLKAPGHFIDEATEQVEEVKRRHSLAALFEGYGVKLTKTSNNGEHKGLCPWHDDHNPSLSVNETEGVYHCFSCHEKGDIIGLVRKMEGLSFKDAIRKLEGTASKPTGKSERKKPEEKKEPGTTDGLSKPDADKEPISRIKGQLDKNTVQDETIEAAAVTEDAGAETSPLITLTDISAYYHNRLFESKPAIEYLEKRGITDKTLFERFQIGFSDGSILTKLSANQKEGLKATGIITGRNAEHFRGCIVFPITDESGRVVGIYGRRIADDEPQHLYLPGPHRGIWNRKASIVYDEIILTESIIDALSLVRIGSQNVQPLYGSNGFTAEHLKTLKDDNVKTIVLALDNDEAGRKASESLATKLLEERFTVKIIFPKVSKDWNEELVAGLDKETFRLLIEEATAEKNEGRAAGLECTKEGADFHFDIDGLHYRIAGLSDDIHRTLHCTAMVCHGDECTYDTLNLYNAKARAALANKISYKFGLPSDVAEEHLTGIIRRIEEMRDRTPAPPGSLKSRSLTTEEIVLGEGYLLNPNLIDMLKSDLVKMGCVGEETNSALLYLIGISRKTPAPLSAYIIGRSSGGKSWLVKRTSKLVPEDDLVMINSASDQSMYYTGNELAGKLVCLGEFEGVAGIEQELRELISDGKISRLVTMKDPNTGAMHFVKVEATGPLAFISTSTNPDINPENLSRCLILYADEKQTQTQAIYEYQLFLKSKEGMELAVEMDEIVKKHHAAQSLLAPIDVINPFEKYIRFPSLILKGRRVHINFLSVIDMVAFLYQKQRARKTLDIKGRRITYIEGTVDDYRIAYNLMMGGILENTLDEMPKAAKDFHILLEDLRDRKAAEEKKEPKTVLITRREMIEHTGWSPKQVRMYTEKLLESECIETVAGTSRGERHKYRVLRRQELIGRLLEQIPTPDEIEKKLALSMETT